MQYIPKHDRAEGLCFASLTGVFLHRSLAMRPFPSSQDKMTEKLNSRMDFSVAVLYRRRLSDRFSANSIRGNSYAMFDSRETLL
jgi:hypothetical protein